MTGNLHISLMPGDLVLVLGPMFAGKSTTLAAFAGDNYPIFFPAAQREAEHSYNTHDGQPISGATILKDPKRILNYVKAEEVQIFGLSHPVVLIDELVLWPNPKDLIDVIHQLMVEERIVIGSSFDSDINGIEPAIVTHLKRMATKILRLTATCPICNQPATRTQKVRGSKNAVIEPGAQYELRCEKHFQPLWSL